MEWVPSILVLAHQNRPVPADYDIGVLLKEIRCVNVEVAVSLDGISVMVHCTHELSMLDVQVFESETLLDLVELVESVLLERNSLVVEQGGHHLEVPLIAHDMEAMAAFFIKVQFLAEVLGGHATLDK